MAITRENESVPALIDDNSVRRVDTRLYCGYSIGPETGVARAVPGKGGDDFVARAGNDRVRARRHFAHNVTARVRDI